MLDKLSYNNTHETNLQPKKLYFSWIDQKHKSLIQEKCPGLFDKLESLYSGQKLILSEEEKDFFITAIKEGVPEISNFISGLAGQIWGAHSVHWKENNQWHQENLAAAFWWALINSPSELVDFYLNTTKEEAEQKCQHFFGGQKFDNKVKLK
jgi:hypothetical protein